MHMGVRERILSVRLFDRITQNQVYANKIGITAVMQEANTDIQLRKQISTYSIANSKSLSEEDKIMAKRLRSDCRVGTAEKNLGLPAGTFRNKNGRDTRSDKKIGTIRKEHNKGK